MNFDYYNNRTVDMIVPISMPYSAGVNAFVVMSGQLNQIELFCIQGGRKPE